MRGKRRKFSIRDDNPAVRRRIRENPILLREAEIRARHYEADPLPEKTEERLRSLAADCAETGRVIALSELCEIVSDQRLSEGEIARIPDGLTAFLLAEVYRLADNEASFHALSDSLRRLESFEHRILFESGVLHRTLLADPAGIYAQMHPRSQGEYRAVLARLAQKAKISETDAAERVLR